MFERALEQSIALTASVKVTVRENGEKMGKGQNLKVDQATEQGYVKMEQSIWSGWA
jgi:hypothetical protein